MNVARGLRIGVLAGAVAFGTGTAEAALTLTFTGQASWAYPQVGTTWNYSWSIEMPVAGIAPSATFDWSSGLPEDVTASFRATRVPLSGPETEVVWSVIGFGYNLEPGGACPFPSGTGSEMFAGPGDAVCAQIRLAPQPGAPEFGDALVSMTARGMTLLDFITDGESEWLSTLVLTYRDEAPDAAYFAALSFRGTAMPDGLVPADFTPPGGLPEGGFPVPPGGSIPPEFLPPENGPPVAVPEPAALGLLGLGVLGLAAARRLAR